MKLLKQSTVIRELKNRGWIHLDHMDDPDAKHFMLDGYGGSRLFARVESHGRIVIKDGRLQEHSNVHIVSYLGPFKSMQQMRQELNSSQEIYTELCGTQFSRIKR